MIFDRELRARVNQLAHRIGQQTAQAARQRIADRLEELRGAGADRAAVAAFLQACEQAGQVVDLVEFK